MVMRTRRVRPAGDRGEILILKFQGLAQETAENFNIKICAKTFVNEAKASRKRPLVLEPPRISGGQGSHSLFSARMTFELGDIGTFLRFVDRNRYQFASN